ncbi:hypothetical protein LFYK43_11860 [Ligilactobacillus salitolerans]|uniref:DUF454 domain-containing protein n=1 Tax=Ligilactobacillus salitolerans TaxID=1808352 RepID=A0A401IT97_9LACO|nr:DUF454 family protein [Ligilactobacillus salitolerans]GBG94727.1 hypothetical protein LFYK43_11860 [Ligilactobacillus salitolerans]
MANSLMKLFWILVTTIAFLLALVGLAIPVLPQLPFFIAGFFSLSKASPRFHRWVTHTKLYRKLFNGVTEKFHTKKKSCEERGIKWYETIYFKLMSVFTVQD